MVNLATVPTPVVVIDRKRLRANIARMQTRATRAGVRLRPHAKTHKSPVIARWQIEAGACGICCAKLGEAEVFAAAGIKDIRLPYPVSPSNADRVMALQDRARVSIIVDDEEVARGWSDAMQREGRRLEVLAKVDVGFHRCGVDPEAAGTAGTIARIAALPGLDFRGLLSHAGHAYGATSEDAIRGIARRECELLLDVASRVRAIGVDVRELSVGSTPTARFIGTQHGMTEMRPGNYVFLDCTQAGLGAAGLDDCAMSVISTVVSRPAPERVVFDAGAKTLTMDAARGFGGTTGHGLVFPSIDAAAPDETIVLERLSEEHGVARVPASNPLRPGDRVRILPNHACVVTNLMDELLLLEGSTIVDTLSVEARGRIA